MKLKKIIGWTAFGVGAFLILIIAVVAVAMIFGITINLDGIRGRVDEAATRSLGRAIGIEGSIDLVVSLQPGLEIKGVRIANPDNWESGDFARVDLVRGQIDILPLLKGKIQIGEIVAEGVRLNLATKKNGDNNWYFDHALSSSKASKELPDGGGEPVIEFVEVRELVLHQVAVIYKDGGLDETYRVKLESLDGTAVAGEPLLFTMWGTFQKEGFNFTLKGDPLAVLFDPEKRWEMELAGKVAESPIKIKGAFYPREDVSQASLEILAEKVEIGEVMERLGIAEGMEVTTDQMTIKMVARGKTLKEVIEKSDFSTTLTKGQWLWKDPENLTNMHYAIDHGNILSSAGQPIELDVEGRIQDYPFRLDITGDSLADLLIKEKPWSMKLSAEMASAVLEGKGVLDRSGEIPFSTYDLVSKGVDVGKILDQWNVAKGVNATIETVHLVATARGKTPSELFQLSDLTTTLTNGQFTSQAANGKDAFMIDIKQGEIQSSTGKPVRMSIRGGIDKKPYSLDVTGDEFVKLLRGKQPWSLKMAGKFDKSPVEVNGTLMREGESPEAKLDLVTGKMDIGEILSWLNITEGINATVERNKISVAARGKDLKEMLNKSYYRYILENGQWSLQNPNMKSPVRVILDKVTVQSSTGKPIMLTGDGRIEKRSVSAIQKPAPFKIRATAQKKQTRVSETEKSKEVVLPIYALTVNGNIASSALQFKGTFNPGSDIPAATLDLVSKQVDIGGILNWLEIAEGLEATVDGLKMKIAAKGRNLQEVLNTSDFSTSLEKGRLILRDPNTKANTEIKIIEGGIQSFAGKPITITLDGRLDQTPVMIKVQTEKLTAFTGQIDRLPLILEAEASGGKLNLTADVALPLTQRKLDFKMSFTGKKMNGLAELLDVSLPPLGPYAVGGGFSVQSDGYKISDLDVRIGQSDLTGRASLLTTGTRPRLDIDLTTNTLQLNDFDFEGWSAIGKEDPVTKAEKVKETATETKEDQTDLRDLLSLAVMKSFDARMAVKVNEVLSGKDSLGGGSVIVGLENGRFTVNPLQLNIPGGSVKMSLVYEPTADGVVGEAVATIDKFDYGVLARRVKPEAKMKGLISLYVNLKSRARDLDAMMQNVNGYIDFGVWPEDLESGIFDLWAVNLLSAVLPQVDKEQTSKINCLIGQFSVKDGSMTEDKFVIDTTRMRVKGKSKANFKTEEIYLYMNPSGKRAEFFSLATPIEVRGKFSDFGIGVAPGGLIGTSVRFITSPLHVPFRRLFTKNLPSTGEDICFKAIER